MKYHGVQRALDHIRSISETEAEKGRLFERLMATYFREDPIYRDRFSRVWLWKDWVRGGSAESSAPSITIRNPAAEQDIEAASDTLPYRIRSDPGNG